MTAKGNATDLMHFISKQMRMAQVYQPVMIKTLLANGGAATTEEIAKALLAYDVEVRLMDTSGYKDIGVMPPDVFEQRKEKAPFIDSDAYLFKIALMA